MVLLKLHWDVTEATLSAFVAMVRGGREGGSPTRLTEPPAETTSSVAVINVLAGKAHRPTYINMPIGDLGTL